MRENLVEGKKQIGVRVSLHCCETQVLEHYSMKIALFLSILCATSLFAGCSTNQGGSSDQYDTSSGTMEQTGPNVADPSLPQDPNAGPSFTPP